VSHQESKRARQRRRQARYEARQRAGVALYPVPPLGVPEIDALVTLHLLPEAAVDDRARVGEAVASAFQEMVRANIS
jgi:hypothetical protein